MGSFFRTGDAFCISGVELCGITCHPPHRDILKTALGASDHIPWRGHASASEAISVLRSEGYKIAVIEQDSRSICSRVNGNLKKEINGLWFSETKFRGVTVLLPVTQPTYHS